MFRTEIFILWERRNASAALQGRTPTHEITLAFLSSFVVYICSFCVVWDRKVARFVGMAYATLCHDNVYCVRCSFVETISKLVRIQKHTKVFDAAKTNYGWEIIRSNAADIVIYICILCVLLFPRDVDVWRTGMGATNTWLWEDLIFNLLELLQSRLLDVQEKGKFRSIHRRGTAAGHTFNACQFEFNFFSFKLLMRFERMSRFDPYLCSTA